ncbi:MAG: iron ABC transporter permease [Verrucomicrobiota bacterium]
MNRQLQLRRAVDSWSISTVVVCLAILTPLAVIFLSVFKTAPDWQHIQSTVLTLYIGNTLFLVFAVGFVAFLFAAPTAWFVVYYDFPGKRWLSWALVLPLAIPTYVAAFTYYDLLDHTIPLIVAARKAWGFEASQRLEQILRYGLLVLLMSSVLYPYIFFTLRASFMRQQAVFLEAGRMLGKSTGSIFWQIALPLSRPALVAGLGLVAMEVINDYGAVNFFGAPTLTEGIFRTWFGLEDQASAMRLALSMTVLVLILLGFELWTRRRVRFAAGELEGHSLMPVRIRGYKGWLITFICIVPLFTGFLFPVFRLLHWAVLSFGDFDFSTIGPQITKSLILAATTTVILGAVALLFAFCGRVHPSLSLRRIIRVATIGYAIPGAVIAVGVMTLFGTVDQMVSHHILGGSLFALGFAYLIRFLTIAYQPLDAGMNSVGQSLLDASFILGRSRIQTLLRIHLPLLMPVLLAASILVFIDILKELPLTLILRTSDFETLATYAFGFAKEGAIYDCSIPSLCIILAGSVGLILANRWMRPST